MGLHPAAAAVDVPAAAMKEAAAACRQIKTLAQVVSPDEYDAAVARDPLLSPLAALGDRRCGRQLLADAAADARSTIQRLAAAAEGRARLDGIAAIVEQQRCF